MTRAKDASLTPEGYRWYGAGLRFSCLRCHRCCARRHEQHLVLVSRVELDAMAAHLGEDHRAWIDKEIVHRLEDGRRALRFSAQLCPLHDGSRCRVYPARPAQCRTWPFWPENIYSASAWSRRVATLCPGAGQGRLWTREEVERLAQSARLALRADCSSGENRSNRRPGSREPGGRADGL